MTSIIRIKYAIPVNNNEKSSQSEEVDKEILVNINCPLRLILNYIRDTVGLDDTTEFDLCDEISCMLRKLSFLEPCTSGLDVFQADLTYVIITFERDANGQMTNITPLLSGKAAKKCTDTVLKSNALFRKTLSTKSSLKKGQNTSRMV